MMRRFGRQCRGMGKVFVTLVRQTETQLLEMGEQVLPLARAAQAYLHGATHAVGGAAGASAHPADGGARGASPDRTPIATPDAGQGLAPLQDRQRLRSHHCPHLQGQKQLPRPVWPQAWALSPSRRRALSLPCICPWAIRVMPAMWSPWSTTWSRRSPGSGRAPPRPSTRWRAIWRSMTPPCVRRCMRGGFSRWGSRKPSIPSPVAHAGGRPPEPGRGGLAPHPDPVPGAPRLCVWLQPPRGRKHHCQPAVSWSWAPHLQRPSRRDRPNGDGGHGAQRGNLGAHPRVSSVEAGTHVPPTAALEMP